MVKFCVEYEKLLRAWEKSQENERQLAAKLEEDQSIIAQLKKVRVLSSAIYTKDLILQKSPSNYDV